MQLLILYFALFRRFAGDRTASIAPTFALLLIPILGTTGFAIDLSFMFAQRARMQTIVDSAAINYMKQVVTILKTGTSPSHINYANYVAQINWLTVRPNWVLSIKDIEKCQFC